MTRSQFNDCVSIMDRIIQDILNNNFYPDATVFGRFKAAKYRFDQELSRIHPSLLGVIVFEEFITQRERYILTYKSLP